MNRLSIFLLFFFYSSNFACNIYAQNIILDNIQWSENKNDRYADIYTDLLINDTNSLVITFYMNYGYKSTPYLVYTPSSQEIYYIIDHTWIIFTGKNPKKSFRKMYGKDSRIIGPTSYGYRVTQYNKTLEYKQKQSLILLMDTLLNHLLPVIDRDSLKIYEKYLPETGEYKSLPWIRDGDGISFSIYQGSKKAYWVTSNPCEAIEFDLDGIEHRKMLMRAYNLAYSQLATIHDKDVIRYFPMKCADEK